MTSIRQVAKRVLPPRVVDWLRKRLRPASNASAEIAERDPGPTEEYVIGLEARLWSTGSGMSAEKLARTVGLTRQGSRARARGSMALARWYFSQGRADTALRWLQNAHAANPHVQTELDLLRVDCHCQLGQGQAALSYLSRMTRRGTAEQNLVLRVGHTRSLLEPPRTHGSGPMIEALNTVYGGGGYRTIRRRSVTDPVALGNISCDVPAAEPREALPLVTVVVSVRDIGANHQGGISSLLSQSWGKLEVLLVGGPQDEEALAASNGSVLDDDRVIFVSSEANRSWLTAIDGASGELLIGHVYSSWAHPQRIEAQARALIGDPTLRATVSSHMRVGPDLTPRPLGLAPRPRLVAPNPDSTMIRRAGLSPDHAVAALHRVSALFSPVSGDLTPPDDVGVVSEEVPLTLTLATERSDVPAPVRLAE